MEAHALTLADFPKFFEALWGYPPFPWQERLLSRLATGEDPHHRHRGEPAIWPDVLDLPTGSGKTAGIDIAVFHLALEAARGRERRAPIRIAYVVDRRLIVDDTYQRARHLAERLREATDAPESSNPVVLRVARALQGVAGPERPPLLARALRGGAPREDDWARTPVQPTILCSTVDQVGSRLLFRGYGVGDSMKPVHAGLLGSDCLILLDEAHLSNPFKQTLAAIERLRAPDKDRAPFGVAVLTATPTTEPVRPFGLSDADRANPVLSARLQASKPARLVEIGRQGGEHETRRVEEIVSQAKKVLDALQKSGMAKPAVGVVVNRVARARTVFDRLRSELSAGADVNLIIGPARAVDREDRAAELGPIRTRRLDVPRELLKPLVVVATQTIEAGVDIDFDGLVTEAAALDALRQRFGRLNRAGRPVAVEAAVVAHKEDIGAKADDPVYGDRIRATWEKLQQFAAGSDGTVDFGIDALAAQIGGDDIANLAAPTASAPVLLPAYARLWSQTSPIPNADPDVALFLHGPNHSPASVQVVWRADVTANDIELARSQEDARARLIELLGLVPPRAAEGVQIPVWAARAFLARQTAPLADLSDAADREPPETAGSRGRAAFRYAGEDSGRTGVVYARDLRDGDLIVAPADYGGCDEWGWNPASRAAVVDVADHAAQPYAGRRYAVRLEPGLIAQAILGEDDSKSPEGSEERARVEAEWQGKLSEVLGGEADGTDIRNAMLDLTLPSTIRTQLDQLARAKRGAVRAYFPYDGDLAGVVLLAPLGLKGVADRTMGVPSTESDDLGSNPGYAQSLDDHTRDVGQFVAAFAGAADLADELTADLVLAAFLHDAGKADPRFQAWLVGGSPFNWNEGHLLAKSGRTLPRAARQLARLPERWRHEALSVRLAMLHPRFSEANDPTLVLWLIGTHHGHGRPLFPHADPADSERRIDLPAALGTRWQLEPGAGPQSLAFDFDGRDWVQIFDALKDRYGIWGLARLEAFIRLADHRASEGAAGSDSTSVYQEAAE